MKYIVVLGDGMADEPVDELSGKTPLEVANKPAIDYLTEHGELGMVKTVPDGIPPGSDAANLSVMGYDPNKFYTGRSPLEAVSMGIQLSDTDVTLRCNLVTLSDDVPYASKTMIDYSSDEITSEEAAELIGSLQDKLGSEIFHFYPGRSYRHLLVWKNGKTGNILTPPHDILERKIDDYLPKGTESAVILQMMEKSVEIFRDHPVNIRRREAGLRPATSIWLWGEGRRPSLPNFEKKYGLKGSVISAVDLVLGIGLCAGLEPIEVPGATGNIHTNFEGKTQAAIDQLLNKGKDFVYLHIEAPDESGHRYEVENKVKSIEIIDQQMVLPIKEALDASGEEYSIMILPDHPTPLRLRTHTSDPVPYAIYRSTVERRSEISAYTEKNGAATGLYIREGFRLMDRFLKDEDVF
ncbi:MAG: cofactor-independent phosphoglycerate mutase [Bacteroidales bacterium]|jgi:2,3-bisphosphoglycerate-independent phosphoglycerate mutase|nr:cofactor-independent phosphoglycerate mutase [Bacteroidales bacterium]